MKFLMKIVNKKMKEKKKNNNSKKKKMKTFYDFIYYLFKIYINQLINIYLFIAYIYKCDII